MAQVAHLKNWSYVFIDAIASRMAQMLPNLAYVSHHHIPGRTVKACNRGLLNLQGRGFGGSATVGFGEGGAMLDYTREWKPDLPWTSGGHSYLTIGEYRGKALSVVKPHEELEPLEHNHPCRRLLENPNSVDTSFDLMYETIMYLNLCGIAYWWMVPSGLFTPAGFPAPAEIWCMPSHWVWPRSGGGEYLNPENPTDQRLVDYYEIRPWGGLGSAGIMKIPANDMVVYKKKSPLNKIDGYSPMSAVAEWVDTDDSIVHSRWSQMENQARAELLVEMPEDVDADDDRLARLEARFLRKYQGTDNYARPFFAPNGTKVTPLSFNPSEMAYKESGLQIRDNISAAFRLPIAMVGVVEKMTYGSVLATLVAGCENCFNPMFVVLGQQFTKNVCSRWSTPDRQIRGWWDDVSPANPEQVNADITCDQANGSITPNEQRALRGRAPYGAGGDDPILPGPGGQVPLMINTGNTLASLAAAMEPYASMGQDSGGDQDREGKLRSSPPPQTESEERAENRGEQAEDHRGERANAPKIDAPNGKPELGKDLAELETEIDRIGLGDDWRRIKKVLGYCAGAHDDRRGAVDAYRRQTAKTKELGDPPSLLDLPDVRQTNHWACGAAAAMAVGRFFGVGPKTLEDWIKALGTSEKNSTSPKMIADYLASLGLQVTSAQNMTVEDLRNNWRRGFATICPIQEYGIPSKQASFKYGHYVAVIGVVLGNVVVQDSSIDNALERPGGTVKPGAEDPDVLQTPGRSIIDAETWLKSWHDEDADGNKYVRFGISVGAATARLPGAVPQNRLRTMMLRPSKNGKAKAGAK